MTSSLVGSEMCIRDSFNSGVKTQSFEGHHHDGATQVAIPRGRKGMSFLRCRTSHSLDLCEGVEGGRA
eukprot:3111584-Prorocentrum_lima.AAC.1